MRCKRRLGHPVASTARVIYCDTCEEQTLARDLSPEMQSRLACLDVEQEVHCKNAWERRPSLAPSATAIFAVQSAQALRAFEGLTMDQLERHLTELKILHF